MADNPRKTLDDWLAAAREDLRGADPDRLIRETPEGIRVKPLYTAADLERIGHLDSLPGFAPFLRGTRATMCSNRAWTIRQDAGFSTADESNRCYKDGLTAGQTGLALAFAFALLWVSRGMRRLLPECEVPQRSDAFI